MDVAVKVAEVQVRTVELTKSVLKQIPYVPYEKVPALLKSGAVIGWLHGRLFESGEPHLLLKTGDGTLGVYATMHSVCEKHVQIYVLR